VTAPTRRRVLRNVAMLLSVPVALAMAGCLGSLDEPGTSSAPDVISTSAPGSATEESLAGGRLAGLETQVDVDSPDGLAASEKVAIVATLRTWLLSGDCDLMTEAFLEHQTLGMGGARDAQCAYFESIFTTPAFTARDIIVKDVDGTAGRATAVVTDDFSGAESTYTLVDSGDGWLIEAWNI
jgi:hypothetical protein